MMEKLRYKYYSERIATRDNGNVQSHDQEETKLISNINVNSGTAWKVSKYGVISGPYFPVFGPNTETTEKISVFSPNTGKYRLEITLYLDTFPAVWCSYTYAWQVKCCRCNIPIQRWFISLLAGSLSVVAKTWKEIVIWCCYKIKTWKEIAI